MAAKQIANKAEFYTLSRALQLGNRLRQWTREEFCEAYRSAPEALPPQIGVRATSGVADARTGLQTRERAWKLAQGDAEGLLFDEGAPHSHLTLQGEVMADERHLYLRYSHMQVHQRVLWNTEATIGIPTLVRHARGLLASALLQKYLDDMSWACLSEILAEYDSPVVEFSAFDRPVGVLGFNTLIWEVRCGW